MIFMDIFRQWNILSRQQWKIMDKAEKDGRELTARQALEIARNQQRKQWNVESKTLYLTDLGKTYSRLSSEERAIMRRARETGRPTNNYIYKDWKVLLRDEFRKIKKSK